MAVPEPMAVRAGDRRGAPGGARVCRHFLAIVPLLLALLLAGCTTVTPPPDPQRATLPRPIVVIGGYLDPAITATGLARWLRDASGEQRILAVHPGLALSFDGAASRVVAEVERYFPNDDPAWTAEVDVIGISMGGLVARHAAAPNDAGRRRLRIGRLYTIAAPHSGAQAADWFGFIGTGLAMRSRSPFLKRLAERERLTDQDDYPIVAYTRSRDYTVGYGASLPDHLAGETVHYEVPWYTSGHLFAFRDARLRADLLRRLREPVTRVSAPSTRAGASATRASVPSMIQMD